MTSRILAAFAALLCLTFAQASFADESDANTTSSSADTSSNPSLGSNDSLSSDTTTSGDITDSDVNQAGVAGQTTTDTSTTNTGSTTTTGSSDIKASDRAQLAPYSILMQTALTNARDHVQGIKTQLKTMEDNQNQGMTQTKGQSAGISGPSDKIFQMHVKELKDDLSLAQSQEKELRTNISKVPSLKNQDSYKNLGTSLQAVNDQLKTWSDKAQSKTYWQNHEQARTDLNGLEERLNTAIDRAKSFNSSMDVSWVG
jgi:flagellar biosynthesis chaperone FliJ